MLLLLWRLGTAAVNLSFSFRTPSTSWQESGTTINRGNENSSNNMASAFLRLSFGKWDHLLRLEAVINLHLQRQEHSLVIDSQLQILQQQPCNTFKPEEYRIFPLDPSGWWLSRSAADPIWKRIITQILLTRGLEMKREDSWDHRSIILLMVSSFVDLGLYIPNKQKFFCKPNTKRPTNDSKKRT